MSKVNNRLGNLIKIGGIVALLLVAAYFTTWFPKSSSIDFSIIRDKLRSAVFEEKPAEELATASAEVIEMGSAKERKDVVDTRRARHYVESATDDYYKGSYEDALRRLDRAKIYDPHNYSVFKLSGQIFFEKQKFRKAFNNLERASQLPNSDHTISRDIDVLKRLLRYSRTEIDKLQRKINREPNNSLARARLKELREQMQK
ncbi:MAG: tetratricopeptide repeat protein [Candidatus Rifleibacteriota bacterium]